MPNFPNESSFLLEFRELRQRLEDCPICDNFGSRVGFFQMPAVPRTRKFLLVPLFESRMPKEISETNRRSRINDAGYKSEIYFFGALNSRFRFLQMRFDEFPHYW